MLINIREKKLFEVLYIAQETYGYIPQHISKEISARYSIPGSKLYEIIKFYSAFSSQKKNVKYDLMICDCTRCHIIGAGKFIETLAESPAFSQIELKKIKETGFHFPFFRIINNQNMKRAELMCNADVKEDLNKILEDLE